MNKFANLLHFPSTMDEEYLKQIFDVCDEDKNGQIDKGELGINQSSSNIVREYAKQIKSTYST